MVVGKIAHCACAVADTYYRQRTPVSLMPWRKSLRGDDNVADVVVIGAGLAGIQTALELTERGVSVVVLEQDSIGSGASGVNGGFVMHGYAMELDELIERVGLEKAKWYHRMTLNSQQKLRERLLSNNIECEMDDTGSLDISMFDYTKQEWREDIKILNREFDLSLEYWPQEKIRDIYQTEVFRDGIYDPANFSVNPLKMILGLARVAEDMGATIYERSRVISVEPHPLSMPGSSPTKIEKRWAVNCLTHNSLEHSRIYADHVVYAGSAYNSELNVFRKIGKSIVGVHTYIGVTEPIPSGTLDNMFNGNHFMACDNRFAFNYFRPLPDRRLLWGGFCQTYEISNEALHQALKENLLQIFPMLHNVKFESMWGGKMGMARHWMPLIGTDSQKPGLWWCTAFAGHGLVPTALGGELIASAIANQDSRWQKFTEDFQPVYAGWPFGALAAQIVYSALTVFDGIELWWTNA